MTYHSFSNFSRSLLAKKLFSLFVCTLLISFCYDWADPTIAIWVSHQKFKQFLFFEYATYLANVVVWATVLYYFYFAVSFAARREGYLKKIPSPFQFENSVNQSVECDPTNHQSSSNGACSSKPYLPSSISHLPSPTAAAVPLASHLSPPTTMRPIGRIVILQYPFLNVANSVAISVFMKDALKFMFGRYWPNTWSNNNPSLLHDHAYGFHCFHSGVAYQSFPSGHTTIVVAAATAIWLTYPRGPWRWLSLLGALAVIIGLLAENYHFLGDCIAGAWVGAITAIYVTSYSLWTSESQKAL